MADRTELEFVIDGYTPDTLPMARLAEYLIDLANLLGEKDRVHFVRVGEGSASLVHRIESVALPGVHARIANARLRDSASEERHAFEALDRKLRDDNTTGELRELGAPDSGPLLYFPGPTRDLDPAYGPFNEKGTITGRVISVGGKRNPVNVNIQDGETVYYCEATRDTALQLAPLMFYTELRVHGMGRYIRNPDGVWEMKSFRIASVERPDQRPLTDVVERLRGITRRVGLDRDILTKLADLRSDPTEA